MVYFNTTLSILFLEALSPQIHLLLSNSLASIQAYLATQRRYNYAHNYGHQLSLWAHRPNIIEKIYAHIKNMSGTLLIHDQGVAIKTPILEEYFLIYW